MPLPHEWTATTWLHVVLFPASAFFPDYAARIAEAMDLRTVGEKLGRGVYRFGMAGDVEAAAERRKADVLKIFSNCRAYVFACLSSCHTAL